MTEIAHKQWSDADMERFALASSALMWASESNILLQSGRYSLFGHEYQADWFIEDHPQQCFLKGAQIGATEVNVLKTLHGMIFKRYPQGAMYLFPTSDDVSDFSKARWSPLITSNPFTIGIHVTNTDAAQIKNIAGAMLYLRGARATRTHGGAKRTSTKLKSAPVDRLVFDERDEMSSDMVELALARIDHSKIKEQIYLSTPTIPDYGIDKAYQESDGRVWMIKCRGCGRYTCLELEFPTCLHRTVAGSLPDRVYKETEVVRICTKCRNKEIYPRDGRWVAQWPKQLEAGGVGWWISQLNSVYVDPKSILDPYENPRDNDQLSEVYNSKLGMAWIAAENRLTKETVLDRCSVNPMAGQHDGPCAAGVDVGNTLHVVIGRPRYSADGKPRGDIIKMARVTEFNDVFDLCRRYGVKNIVFDLRPETRKVREFRTFAHQHGIETFGCEYSEHQKGAWAWNEREGVVTVNRTELCDASHTFLSEPGHATLPRKDAEVEEFATECSQIAKVLEEDAETGSRIYRYRKLGADHYRHSVNYFLLACSRLEPAMDMTTGTDAGEGKKEPFFYG